MEKGPSRPEAAGLSLNNADSHVNTNTAPATNDDKDES